MSSHSRKARARAPAADRAAEHQKLVSAAADALEKMGAADDFVRVAESARQIFSARRPAWVARLGELERDALTSPRKNDERVLSELYQLLYEDARARDATGEQVVNAKAITLILQLLEEHRSEVSEVQNLTEWYQRDGDGADTNRAGHP